MPLPSAIPAHTAAVPRRARLPAALGAAALGAVILFGVGFLQGKADVVHNAAHDSRHSLSFPCH
ncbi:MAG TPA: CbtB-domain containing protein [Gammaproteobacteria bacterium]|nr:CbtB-domain containing protein [Gammaproteobacteria bacterium]